MIIVGVCVGASDKFERIALPSIRRCLGPAVTVIERREQTSIFEAYNSILDEVSTLEDLEAVVLMHDDVELRDEQTVTKLTDAFAGPNVGVVGVIGSLGMTDMRWHRFDARGMADTPDGPLRYEPVSAQVDAVDGIFMALSPTVARTIRFDADTFHGFHGYDADYCFTVRAAGLAVVVAPIDLFHHSTGARNRLSLERATLQWRLKWLTDAGPLQRGRWRIGLAMMGTKTALWRFGPTRAVLNALQRRRRPANARS